MEWHRGRGRGGLDWKQHTLTQTIIHLVYAAGSISRAHRVYRNVHLYRENLWGPEELGLPWPENTLMWCLCDLLNMLSMCNTMFQNSNLLAEMMAVIKQPKAFNSSHWKKTVAPLKRCQRVFLSVAGRGCVTISVRKSHNSRFVPGESIDYQCAASSLTNVHPCNWKHSSPAPPTGQRR